MSYAQKMALCEAIVKLHPKQLQFVVNIIAEEEPELLEKSETEYSFDVNVLKSSSLWSLKKFVDGFSQKIKNNNDPIKTEDSTKSTSIIADHVVFKSESIKTDPNTNISGVKFIQRDEDGCYKKLSSLNMEDLAKVSKSENNPSEKFTITIEVHDIREGTTCPNCKKQFKDRSNLIKHVRTHSGEMPYECNQCGKAFRHTTTLKAHLNTHKDTNPWVCSFPDCNKSFSNQPNLKRHIRTHTGEKPFTCSFCGKAFSQSSNCKQHEKLHEKKWRQMTPSCIC